MTASNPLLKLAAWSARRLPMPVKQAMYRIRPLARLIRGSLNRAAPQGLSEVTVAAGPLEGLTLLLDLQTEKDYWLGTYEPELQAAAEKYLRPGMVVYDVGANIGYISIMLSRRVGKTGGVFSFEALPSNLERLQRNIALNHLEQKVIAIHAAVINEQRPVRFLVGPSGGMGKAEGSAGRQEYAYGEAIQVDGISLDYFVFDQKYPLPSLVKMDIEGGEVLALPGMRRTLAEVRPLVFLELHGHEAAQAAWDAFAAAGYTLCAMQPGYPAIPSLDALDWKAYLIAIPKESQAK